MTKIVLFSGRKRHGKDSAANILGEWVKDKTVAKFAFAQYLKKIAKWTLNLNTEEEEFLKEHDDIKVAGGMSYRQFLNKLGDAIKMNLSWSIWAERIIEEIDSVIEYTKADYVIITDLRYPIEQSYLKRYAEKEGIDLVVVKVVRTDYEFNDEHESESLVDEINPDFIIEAKDITELENKMKEIKNELL
jgi:hypothetical protein